MNSSELGTENFQTINGANSDDQCISDESCSCDLDAECDTTLQSQVSPTRDDRPQNEEPVSDSNQQFFLDTEKEEYVFQQRSTLTDLISKYGLIPDEPSEEPMENNTSLRIEELHLLKTKLENLETKFETTTKTTMDKLNQLMISQQEIKSQAYEIKKLSTETNKLSTETNKCSKETHGYSKGTRTMLGICYPLSALGLVVFGYFYLCRNA